MKNGMNVDRWVRLIGGAFVSASLLMGIYVDSRFLWFTLFVGLNLVQSAFTDWCPLMTILRRLGVPDAAPGPRATETHHARALV